MSEQQIANWVDVSSPFVRIIVVHHRSRHSVTVGAAGLFHVMCFQFKEFGLMSSPLEKKYRCDAEKR